MNSKLAFASLTFYFAVIYFAFFFLWFELEITNISNYWFVVKNIFPFYLALLAFLTDFKLSRKLLPLAKVMLIAAIFAVAILNIPYINTYPKKAINLFGIFTLFHILVYSFTSLFLIHILEAKLNSTLLILSITICLIAFISEAWELPHHIINLATRQRATFNFIRYIETMIPRLTLIIPLIGWTRRLGFNKNKLFKTAFFLSITTIPMWTLNYSPITRLLRIPYALLAIGYAKGICPKRTE